MLLLAIMLPLEIETLFAIQQLFPILIFFVLFFTFFRVEYSDFINILPKRRIAKWKYDLS